MRRLLLLVPLLLLPACGGRTATPAPSPAPSVAVPPVDPGPQQAACAQLTQVRAEAAALQDQVTRAQAQGDAAQAAPLQARLQQLQALQAPLQQQCELTPSSSGSPTPG